jgi:hypothetical protein
MAAAAAPASSSSATPECGDGHAVLRHGRREAGRLVEVEPGARSPILRNYLTVAPGGRSHIPVDPKATSRSL